MFCAAAVILGVMHTDNTDSEENAEADKVNTNTEDTTDDLHNVIETTKSLDNTVYSRQNTIHVEGWVNRK